MTEIELYLPQLKEAFSGQRYVRKADLRAFYRERDADFSENAFRRILYALQKRNQVAAMGAGVYQLARNPNAFSPPEKFIPQLSPELRQVFAAVSSNFPYAEYLFWETRMVHEFMRHQPGQNQIFIETRNDVSESIFNFLNQAYLGQVFLHPDQLTFERYIVPRASSMILTTLYSQSPRQPVDGIPTARLEKILVDLFADEAYFYLFQGAELVQIFESAFARYQVSQKGLFRYARRRKIASQLYTFIQTKTNIELIHFEDHHP